MKLQAYQDTETLKAIDVTCHVLSPVHVGGAQEKHLKKNVDYVYDGQKQLVKLVNWEETISQNPDHISDITADLQSGRIGDNRKYSLYFAKSYRYSGAAGADLNSHIRTGMGDFYIPGTSLKGALKSSVTEAYQTDLNRGEIKRANDLNQLFTGSFHSDLFSFLNVGDFSFGDDVFLCNSKIYNVNEQRDGTWKNGGGSGRNNHRDFREGDFSTLAECIRPGATATGKLVFKQTPFDDRLREMSRKNKDILSRDWKADAWEWFEVTVKSYMQKYIDQELAYYKRFNQADHGYDIQEDWEKLKHYHDSLPRGCFMVRMGWGTGFHSITGNWQYANHVARAENMKNKSRKICFWREGDTLRFAPLGFLVLSRKDLELPENPFALDAAHLTPIDNDSDVEEPEKFEPVIADPVRVRNNDEVHAQVVGNEGKTVLAKVFIEGMEDDIVRFRYPAGLPQNEYVVVKVQFKRRKLKEGYNVIFIRKAE